MAFPRKEQRNHDLIEKVHSGWTYEKLGGYFGLNPKTAWEIHDRHCKNTKCPVKVRQT